MVTYTHSEQPVIQTPRDNRIHLLGTMTVCTKILWQSIESVRDISHSGEPIRDP